MKEYQKLIYIFMILFLVGGCKMLEKKATEIKNSFGIQSSEESIENDNSIEITVSCGEDSNIEQYINELSGYSGGAGTSVKVTATTRSPKTDTETIDISVDVKDVSDKGISEESQDFVVSDKNSETSEEGKAFDSSSEKFESTETSDSRTETTDSKSDQTIEINVTINEQVDKYSSEHSDLQSSYTSEQSAEISKEATNFKDSVNSLKEQYDKGEISKTDFISSLTAEANKSLDKAAEIAPQESKAYDELKDGIDEALKAAESENITKGTDEGDESGDKDSDSDKDSGSNDSSSDSIIKGLKDPDMWIGAIVGAVGIEALKKGSEVLYNLYKDNS